MKPLFKNKTILSQENYMHLVEFHQKKNNWKYWLYTAVFSILFLFCTVSQITAQNYLLAFFWFLFFLSFLGYRFLYPYYKTVKEIKSDKVQKKLINYFFFYDKYFKIKNTIENSKLKYYKLYKVYENENYFYLYLNKSNALIIEKVGFTIGNQNEFRKFIKNKVGFKFKKN